MVGGHILGEGIECVEETGSSFAGKCSSASLPGVAPQRPGFGRDMPWDYIRHPWVRLHHTDRNLDSVVNDARARNFHQEMRHNAGYLSKPTYSHVCVVKAYCYLFEIGLEYTESTKVVTSKNKDRQLVMFLIEDPDVVRAL